MKKHFKIRVTGKVQGVFYRASAKEKAIALGMTGFVRNEADGSVYIEAEGTTDQLEQLMVWCRQGPAHANVSDVSAKESEMVGYAGFEIQR